MDREIPMSRLFAAMIGLFVWAGQFTVIYAATSTLCARGWADIHVFGFGIVETIIITTTILAVLVTAISLWLALRARAALGETGGTDAERFLLFLTAVVSGLSLVAIIYNGVPALMLPPCG